MIYIAICYDSCYNKAKAADRPVIRASTSFSGNIRGEFASTWFRGQGPCERGPEKDASAALREKDFVRYSENFAQRFQLVRINMALAHLHLGKRTARYVASAHLKLCRRLFPGKAFSPCAASGCFFPAPSHTPCSHQHTSALILVQSVLILCEDRVIIALI